MSVLEIALGVMLGRWLSDIVPFVPLAAAGIAARVFGKPAPSGAPADHREAEASSREEKD